MWEPSLPPQEHLSIQQGMHVYSQLLILPVCRVAPSDELLWWWIAGEAVLQKGLGHDNK